MNTDSDHRPVLSRSSRWLLLGTIGAGLLMIYFILGKTSLRPPRIVAMPTWVPFEPAFGLPYFLVLIAGWWAPMGLSCDRRFKACLHSAIIALLLATVIWVFFPTELPRPPLPEGWINLPYRWIVFFDAPTNILPCAHVIPVAVSCWYLGRERPRWRPFLVLGLLLCLPTISLTWQHRPIDVLIGLGLSSLGIAVGEMSGRDPFGYRIP